MAARVKRTGRSMRPKGDRTRRRLLAIAVRAAVVVLSVMTAGCGPRIEPGEVRLRPEWVGLRQQAAIDRFGPPDHRKSAAQITSDEFRAAAQAMTPGYDGPLQELVWRQDDYRHSLFFLEDDRGWVAFYAKTYRRPERVY